MIDKGMTRGEAVSKLKQNRKICVCQFRTRCIYLLLHCVCVNSDLFIYVFIYFYIGL